MEADKIIVKWQAEDGYVGKDRPQSVSVRMSDFDEGQTVEDIADGIRECIEDDFQQKVTAAYDDGDVIAAAKKIHAALQVVTTEK